MYCSSQKNNEWERSYVATVPEQSNIAKNDYLHPSHGRCIKTNY
jgi:hypothetical protein